SSGAKKASGDVAAVVNNHSAPKPSPAATEAPEAAGQSPDSDHKGDGSEESPGGVFDHLKPLIIAGGVAVAALAVIVGVAFLARKK
ncbi:CEND protein, partial [Piaya cayana]|nr:CEND protein [Piaya cayana]